MIMIGHGKYLFYVQGDVLYRIDPKTADRWTLSDGWEGARSIASTGRSLCILQGSTLYEVDPRTGDRVQTILDDLDG